MMKCYERYANSTSVHDTAVQCLEEVIFSFSSLTYFFFLFYADFLVIFFTFKFNLSQLRRNFIVIEHTYHY